MYPRCGPLMDSADVLETVKYGLVPKMISDLPISVYYRSVRVVPDSPYCVWSYGEQIESNYLVLTKTRELRKTLSFPCLVCVLA